MKHFVVLCCAAVFALSALSRVRSVVCTTGCNPVRIGEKPIVSSVLKYYPLLGVVGGTDVSYASRNSSTLLVAMQDLQSIAGWQSPKLHM